jgi:hypothetical protein
MSYTYTWKIENMAAQKQLDVYTDVVIEVGWTCTGTDGMFYAVIPGLTRIVFTGEGPFVPYNELSQDQVLSWIWSSGVDRLVVQSQIDSELDLQINPPTIVLPLPWAN